MTILKDQTYFPYIQNIGVVLFFLLAGFLTTYSLESKNHNHDYSFKTFFKHKSVRFMKELSIGLICIAIIDFMAISFNNTDRYLYKEAFNIKTFIGNLLMLQDTTLGSMPHLKITSFGSGRPLWTLATEYWFYMIFAFWYLVIANKKSINFTNIILLSLITIIPINHFIGGRGSGLGFVFLLGVLIYYSFRFIDSKTAKILLPISLIIYIIQGSILKEAYSIVSFIILAATITFGLVSFQNISESRNKVVAFISGSTFMLYLIHYSLIDFILNSNLKINNIIKFWLGIIISIVLSIIFYKILTSKRQKNNG